MRKKHLLIVFLFLSLFLNAYASSPFYGEILEVNLKGKYFKVFLFKKKRYKKIRFTDTTKFYKKLTAQPKSLRAKASDFKKGDIILIFSKNPNSSSPIAYKVWERRALLYKNRLVQTEVKMYGEVVRVKGKYITIHTFDGEEKILVRKHNSRVFIKGKRGNFSDIKPAIKVYVVCRWLGFEEDKPKYPTIHTILDSSTYVMNKFRDRFGGIIANGTVTGVDPSRHLIKVGSTRGEVFSVYYDGKTRWIPATPQIKKPEDFVGYRIIVFGEAKSKKAKMILNTIGVNPIFEVIAKQGDIPGVVTIIAYGKLLSTSDKYMTVKYKGRKVRCVLTKNTVYFRKGKKVGRKEILVGDRVLIKGIYRTQPISLVVISFGKD